MTLPTFVLQGYFVFVVVYFDKSLNKRENNPV